MVSVSCLSSPCFCHAPYRQYGLAAEVQQRHDCGTGAQDIHPDADSIIGSAEPAQIRGRVDADGGLAVERAAVLADAAADAAIVYHNGAPDIHRLASGCRHRHILQDDGFFGHGAHLLAHQAVAIVGPRQTAVAIDVCVADHRQPFVVQGQRRNRTGGTGAAAGVATVIAAAQARDKHRSPQPRPPGLRQARLEA
jgi:hypothetical protein